MKTIKRLLIIFLATFLLVACEDQLNQLPQTSILADNYYTTEENVESTVTAVYHNLQSMYSYYMIPWGEIPSDNTYVQAPNSNGGLRSMEDFTWTSIDGFVTSIWENAYHGILWSNTVLEVIEKIHYKSETTKAIRKGEMKFMRGFLYYLLTVIYGEVPLVIKTEDPTYAFNDTRAPITEIYTQIEKDLLEAIEALPTTNSPGRVDAYAARAILAKHYMRLQDFGKAELLLEAIVASDKYMLVGIDELYGVENEGNKEDVFSVQYVSDLNGKTEGNGYYYYFTLPDNQGGRGVMAMEKAMYNAYEENDLRKNLVNPSGNDYYINKWTPSPSTALEDGGDNAYIIRYADVLLLYAECLNENNSTPLATTYLDQVRNRANLPGTTASSQTDVRNAIAKERKFELVGEGHRWFDLLRTNTAIETMNSFFASQGRDIVVSPFRLLAPIPQAEVDLTKMIQNPGY